MGIDRRDFGTLETGETSSLFVMVMGPLKASISDYGATLVSLLLPRARGAGEDVILGFSTLAGYAGRHPYFGSIVGRHAGRIGGGRFDLDGKTIELAANDGPNHLHGGVRGFDHRLWKAEAYEEGGEPRVRAVLRSPHGEEGYPGNLVATVVYGLDSAGLSIRLEAICDAPSVVNLANHAYFNLKGAGYGDILGHEVSIRASRYLEATEQLLPTGRLLPVDGSAFDLRSPKPIAAGVAALGGFDHCFALDRETEGLVECAKVREPVTGRSLRVSTTCPGLVFYSGNFLAGEAGKNGARYDRHFGFCLEAQYFPDAVHHADFPSVILRPGNVWREETRYGFEF